VRPLTAHYYVGVGTLYGKVGRAEQVRAELTAAAELYRALAMMFCWSGRSRPWRKSQLAA
jgi:hypothetical protein